MTINLEKELIRQNRKLATPSQLLLIKELETNAEFITNDALSRVGLNQNLIGGKSIKDKILMRQQETKAFSQERVFHISQIKEICEKYYLRFLPSQHYRGTIDKQLAEKITNFEAAYLVKCRVDNTKIVAPKESFELQRTTKDPLFFYQINEEYFYLIHKWGNDLNWSRSLMKYFTSPLICAMTIVFTELLISLIIFYLGFSNQNKGVMIIAIIFGAVSIVLTLIIMTTEDATFFPENDWDSPYERRGGW